MEYSNSVFLLNLFHKSTENMKNLFYRDQFYNFLNHNIILALIPGHIEIFENEETKNCKITLIHVIFFVDLYFLENKNTNKYFQSHGHIFSSENAINIDFSPKSHKSSLL